MLEDFRDRQLSKADPVTALPVLQKLLPSATFSADAKTRAIAATATAEQHQSIAAAVGELDKLSSPAETKVYYWELYFAG